jgi:hypothetical protein
MARLIPKPTVIEAAGNKPKLIEEYFGRVNSGTTAASIARMRSPGGWVEPGQTPEFDEYTVKAGQAVHSPKGEWVQYGSPHPDGAEYIAVCLPAFAPDTVHRDA